MDVHHDRLADHDTEIALVQGGQEEVMRAIGDLKESHARGLGKIETALLAERKQDREDRRWVWGKLFALGASLVSAGGLGSVITAGLLSLGSSEPAEEQASDD